MTRLCWSALSLANVILQFTKALAIKKWPLKITEAIFMDSMEFCP